MWTRVDLAALTGAYYADLECRGLVPRLALRQPDELLELGEADLLRAFEASWPWVVCQ